MQNEEFTIRLTNKLTSEYSTIKGDGWNGT